MAKKIRKSTTSSFNIPLILLIILLIFLGFIVYNKSQENRNVKGESIGSTMPMVKREGNAGEACGRSIKRACRQNLICAPLGPAYRVLQTRASELELTAETETASTEELRCIGKTEDEIKGGCMVYLPYYGACVKKGVWPPPNIKPTPILKPTTTTTSCRWCGTDCIDVTNRLVKCVAAPIPAGYSCVNINNVCTKQATGATDTGITPTPTPQAILNSIKLPSWLGGFGQSERKE